MQINTGIPLSLIWAMTRNRVIGRDNDLPWQLPKDMKFFMQTTLGKPVIMGRKQFQSMPRPLPRRSNIVLTRDTGFDPGPGSETAPVLVAHDLDSAIGTAREIADRDSVSEIMVIGGAEIYALTLPRAERLYCTLVDTELQGDTFFPEFDESAWREVSREQHDRDERHAYDFCIKVLEKAE